MTYAAATRVEIGTTRHEIERILAKHGADAFGSMQDGKVATVAFRLGGLSYRFRMEVPDSAQKGRARWRALLLVIKARLEGVAAGVETIEEAFMANTVTETGETVAERMKPEFEQARLGGRMPKALSLAAPR